jgi:hypothetical protein
MPDSSAGTSVQKVSFVSASESAPLDEGAGAEDDPLDDELVVPAASAAVAEDSEESEEEQPVSRTGATARGSRSTGNRGRRIAGP